MEACAHACTYIENVVVIAVIVVAMFPILVLTVVVSRRDQYY